MTKFVLIEKTSDCKEVEVKNLKIEDLYKKCGYRKVTDDFKLLTKWDVKVNGKHLHLCLYGKVHGKSGTENKTELPPPVDKELYFGTLALVNYNEVFYDLTIEDWHQAYEKLYGGFENLAELSKEDEEEENELDYISDSDKTKSGYLKDGFVVTSSDETDSNSFTDDDDDVEEEQYEFSDEDF
tara:strand:+ start:186 stop:734 length:549 start_codon:yes stop_codon:yes gene_type:complete